MSNPNPIREPSGQFKSPASNSPIVATQERFRALLLKCVKPSHMKRAYNVLFNAMKRGEPWAVTGYLDRMTGKPSTAIIVERSAPETRIQIIQLIRDRSNFDLADQLAKQLIDAQSPQPIAHIAEPAIEADICLEPNSSQ